MHRQRIEHERFLKTRMVEAEFVEKYTQRANHDRTEQNAKVAEWAQRKFLEKYKHSWREFLPERGNER